MTFYLEMNVFCACRQYIVLIGLIALRSFDDSSFEKVLTGHSNGNSECFLFYHDFLSEHFKVFPSEAALNKMTDLDWMAITL